MEIIKINIWPWKVIYKELIEAKHRVNWFLLNGFGHFPKECSFLLFSRFYIIWMTLDVGRIQRLEYKVTQSGKMFIPMMDILKRHVDEDI